MTQVGPNYVGTGGSTAISGSWGTLSNAEGSGAATYATWTSTTRSASATWQGASFALSVPAGATIDSVLVEVAHRESSTSVISTVTAQLFKSGTAVGSPTTLTKSTTVRTDSFTVSSGVVQADVSGLQVRLVSTRANSTTSATQSVDWARLTVTYTPLPVTVDGTRAVTATVSGAADVVPGVSSVDVAGDLAVTATLPGGAAGIRPAGGAQPVTATLAGAGQGIHPASGSLPATASLGGAAVAIRPAAGNLSAAGTLSGAAVAVHAVAGSLAATVTLAGEATTGAPPVAVEGALAGAVTLAGTGALSLPVAGDLAVSVSLAGEALVTVDPVEAPVSAGSVAVVTAMCVSHHAVREG